MMLWEHYVYRRKHEVFGLWDSMFSNRRSKVLYITGRGFDVRARSVLEQFHDSVLSGDYDIEQATLLLIGFQGYELSDSLQELTQENAAVISQLFEKIGAVVNIAAYTEKDGDLRTANALRSITEQVLKHLPGYTDIILDVSSLPRVAYLSLMTGILTHLIHDTSNPLSLAASGVNFQILVAEDAKLDSRIRSEDPSDELVAIPGFSWALQAEGVQGWPLVWFPMLGENRTGQFSKIAALTNISKSDEICPVLPHPSRNPRRSDDLLIEYGDQLFSKYETPTTNILLAHESNPFEAYRLLLSAMRRYEESLKLLEGCRLLVTPLSSKLMTLAAGLACFEMRPPATDTAPYVVGIPYVEPKRYAIDAGDVRSTENELSSILLTGEAYRQ